MRVRDKFLSGGNTDACVTNSEGGVITLHPHRFPKGRSTDP